MVYRYVEDLPCHRSAQTTVSDFYSTDIVFVCRFSVWSVFPRRFRLVWQTVFLRFRLHRFVPFSIRKSICVIDQSKAVTRRFLPLQKTSFTHAQILQTKTAFAETLFRQEPIRFTQFYMSLSSTAGFRNYVFLHYRRANGCFILLFPFSLQKFTSWK